MPRTPTDRKHWSLDQFDMIRAKEQKSLQDSGGSHSDLTHIQTHSRLANSFLKGSGPISSLGQPHFRHSASHLATENSSGSSRGGPREDDSRGSTPRPPLPTSIAPTTSTTPSTASSPGQYYACPWILPPIPSFSELGLRFDRSRTTSLNAMAALNDSTQGSTPGRTDPSLGVHDHSDKDELNTPAHLLALLGLLPDYLPSIFDSIQSDEDGTFILWSDSTSPPAQSATGTPSSISTSVSISTAASTSASSPPISGSTSANQGSFKTTALSLAPVATTTRLLGANSLKGKEFPLYSRPLQGPKDVAKKRQTTLEATLPAGASKKPTSLPAPNTTSATRTGSRVMMAATVEKLIEKLTSVIDYTFLTDFFLIYRLFITPMALLKLLMLRFQWALMDDTPQRQIVRIRTFVTLRHWLLNYFDHDYMRSKDLRQTLSIHLSLLSNHPLVKDSTRDQRIIKELRRYAQGLKRIHSRAMAQQKLEKQTRKLEQRQQRQQTRSFAPVYPGSSTERSGMDDGGILQWQQSSMSNRSSTVSYSNLNRKSMMSEAMTEELTVEFRSSDMSEEEDDDTVSDDSSDDGFEPSSEESRYENDLESLYSVDKDYNPSSAYPSEDDEEEEEDQEYEEDASSECASLVNAPYPSGDAFEQERSPEEPTHLPSPAFSPRSTTSPHALSSSFRSHHPMDSGVDSTSSRLLARGTRPKIPDFYSDTPPAESAPQHLSRRQSRIRTYPRPMSSFLPPTALLQDPVRSSNASLRSIERYMNPPPRSEVSTEKKKTWSKYMSATVGHLSRMRRVFSSSSNKGHRNSTSSLSMRSLTGSGARGGSGGGGSPWTTKAVPTDFLGQSRHRRSNRHWHSNRSVPDGHKLSQYILGSCTGMSMLASSTEDRPTTSRRQYTLDQMLQRESHDSSWSSEDDCSQYEITRQSSRQRFSPGEYDVEDGGPRTSRHRRNDLDSLRPPQHVCCAELDHRNHSHPSSMPAGACRICSECDCEQYYSSPSELEASSWVNVSYQHQHHPATLKAHPDAPESTWSKASDVEQGHSPMDQTLSRNPSHSKPIHSLQRTARKRDRDHRASWRTFSSTSSSVFGAILSKDHLSPGQTVRGLHPHQSNVDRFVERLYQSQRPASSLVAADITAATPGPGASSHARPLSKREYNRPQESSMPDPTFPNSSRSATLNDLGKEMFYQAGARESWPISSNPKRQTMPVIRLAETVPPEVVHATSDQSSRRHSSEIQSMEGWQTFQRLTQKPIIEPSLDRIEKQAMQHQHNSQDLSTLPAEPWSVQEPSSQDTMNSVSKDGMRGVEQLRSDTPPERNLNLFSVSQSTAPFPPPPTLASKDGRVGQTQTRSNSHPHLLYMSDPELSSVSIKPEPSTYRHSHATPSYHNPKPHTLMPHQPSDQRAVPRASFGTKQIPPESIAQGGVGPQRNILLLPRRIPTSIPLVEKRPLSIILRYRSEMIAQQLCLIERELLYRVQWHEFVTVKKRPPSVASLIPPLATSSAGILPPPPPKDASSAPTSSIATAFSTPESIGTAVFTGLNAGDTLVPHAERGPVSEAETSLYDPFARSEGTATPTPTSTAPPPVSSEKSAQTPRPARIEDNIGIKRIVDRFNLMCEWVTGEILQTRDLETRVKMIEKFIRIAHTCYNHSNFSTLLQIMLGLQSHAVARLSRTWGRVGSHEMRIMQELEDFTRPERNWKNVRDAMRNIVEEWGGHGGTSPDAATSPRPSSASWVPTTTPPLSSGKPISSTLSSIGGSGATGVPLFGKKGAKAGLGKASATVSAAPSSFLQGNAFHSKGSSSPILPSMVSSIGKNGKDKDKEKEGQSKDKEMSKKPGQPGGCIPFMGLFLSDLLYNSYIPSYVEPQGSDILPHQHGSCPTSGPVASVPRGQLLVNLHKHRTVATIVKRVLTFRTMATRYPFRQEADVYEGLLAIQGVDPSEVNRLSALCEERVSEFK